MKKKGIIGTLLTYVLIIGVAMYMISMLSSVKKVLPGHQRTARTRALLHLNSSCFKYLS